MNILRSSVMVGLCMVWASLNACLTPDETAFLRASKKGHITTMKDLVKKGVDINVRDPLDKESALVGAIRNRKIDSVRFLINHGINLNDTSLLVAIECMGGIGVALKKSSDIVKVLLANNAFRAYQGDSTLLMSEISKRVALKNIFDDLVYYEKLVQEKRVDGLERTITSRSRFSKQELTRFSLWNKYNQPLMGAIDARSITMKNVLTLAARIYGIPLGVIPDLMAVRKITFKDLESYYAIAKEKNNKQFGTYCFNWYGLRSLKKLRLPEEILIEIGTFL